MILLTDEEIKGAIHIVFPGIETISYEAAREIAKAQLQKVVEDIIRNTKGYEDRTVGAFLASAYWQRLREEAGLEVK